MEAAHQFCCVDHISILKPFLKYPLLFTPMYLVASLLYLNRPGGFESIWLSILKVCKEKIPQKLNRDYTGEEQKGQN